MVARERRAPDGGLRPRNCGSPGRSRPRAFVDASTQRPYCIKIEYDRGRTFATLPPWAPQLWPLHRRPTTSVPGIPLPPGGAAGDRDRPTEQSARGRDHRADALTRRLPQCDRARLGGPASGGFSSSMGPAAQCTDRIISSGPPPRARRGGPGKGANSGSVVVVGSGRLAGRPQRRASERLSRRPTRDVSRPPEFSRGRNDLPADGVPRAGARTSGSATPSFRIHSFQDTDLCSAPLIWLPLPRWGRQPLRVDRAVPEPQPVSGLAAAAPCRYPPSIPVHNQVPGHPGGPARAVLRWLNARSAAAACQHQRPAGIAGDLCTHPRHRSSHVAAAPVVTPVITPPHTVLLALASTAPG